MEDILFLVPLLSFVRFLVDASTVETFENLPSNLNHVLNHIKVSSLKPGDLGFDLQGQIDLET